MLRRAMSSAVAPAQRVLDFWFGSPIAPFRREWFAVDAKFDADIVTNFSPEITAAVAGGLREWDATPEGAVARIIVLDQFTRNTGRGTARAFAGDVLAQEATLSLLGRGPLTALPAPLRLFALMPLMHAEDAALSARCAVEFEAAGVLDASTKQSVDDHAGVLARFGRYPSRNAALGRASTAEEAAFLAGAGRGGAFVVNR